MKEQKNYSIMKHIVDLKEFYSPDEYDDIEIVITLHLNWGKLVIGRFKLSTILETLSTDLLFFITKYHLCVTDNNNRIMFVDSERELNLC